MSDPRNVAHAKKVVQQKHHQETKSAGQKSKKGKKAGGGILKRKRGEMSLDDMYHEGKSRGGARVVIGKYC